MIYFKGQVDAMLKSKDEVIAVLRMENERLRKEIELEARRANAAVDRLLNQAALPSVTPVERRPMADEILRSVKAAVGVGQSFDEDKNSE